LSFADGPAAVTEGMIEYKKGEDGKILFDGKGRPAGATFAATGGALIPVETAKLQDFGNYYNFSVMNPKVLVGWRSCGLAFISLWKGREASLGEFTRGGGVLGRCRSGSDPPRRLVPRLRPSRREGEVSKRMGT
jgi:hypothetical protein